MGSTSVAIEVTALFLAAQSRICFLEVGDDGSVALASVGGSTVVLTSGFSVRVIRLGSCGDTEC